MTALVGINERPLPLPVAPARPRLRGWLGRLRDDVTGSIAALPVGSAATIVGMSDALAPETARRLVDLGFVPGARIEVLRRAPLADPTLFRVADTEIALRRREAVAVLAVPAQADHH